MTMPEIPTSVPLVEPSLEAPPRRYDFNHIPKLGPAKPGDRRGSLLPEEGGRPGLVYCQVPLHLVRQFEAQTDSRGHRVWARMHDTVRYTIVGPKGHIDMELMAAGRIIDGVPASAVKCKCVGPLAIICEATGLDPTTGFPPTAPIEEPLDVQEEAQGPDLGLEAGSLPGDPECEDPQGQEGPPVEDPEPSRRHGSRNSRRS